MPSIVSLKEIRGSALFHIISVVITIGFVVYAIRDSFFFCSIIPLFEAENDGLVTFENCSGNLVKTLWSDSRWSMTFVVCRAQNLCTLRQQHG
jgi:hypothetical protein